MTFQQPITAPAKYDPRLTRLYDILTYRRPHGSKTEQEFTARYLVSSKYEMRSIDDAGFFHVVRKLDGGDPTTLFSAHVDTVHRSEGRQRIGITASGFIAKPRAPLDEKSPGMWRGAYDKECLGADNGAGCWMLLELIDAGVPGFYLFHRGEERGGIGSAHISIHYELLLSRFQRAVAFDRKDNKSIITFQRGERCCSADFALEVAARLKKIDGSINLELDPTGSFTDTANYTETIPECTNISVGYLYEHGEQERLDQDYVWRLRSAAVQMNWETLPSHRDPHVVEKRWASSSKHRGRGITYFYGGYGYGIEVAEEEDSVLRLGAQEKEKKEDDHWLHRLPAHYRGDEDDETEEERRAIAAADPRIYNTGRKFWAEVAALGEAPRSTAPAAAGAGKAVKQLTPEDLQARKADKQKRLTKAQKKARKRAATLGRKGNA